jgi:crotonobetainyl-CoA:carnitine CoA-transferase CaiB-like acyl-CoA transferase
VIAVFTDQQWEAFREVVGDLEWTKDPRFNTLLGRLQNQDELDKRIEEWTMNHSAEEVMVKMQTAGVPAGVVQNGRDVIEHDPQLKHRDHFRELTHPEMGVHICEMPPPRLSKTPAKLSMPAPCLGEHNEYVCCQVLGMSEDEFINLVAEGVIQ